MVFFAGRMNVASWKNENRTIFELTTGMSRLALAATLLTLSACSGGTGGSSAADSQAAVVAGLNTTSTVAGWVQFIYPTSGQLSVEASHAFQWSAVSGTLGYRLQVGTSPGANDVFDSGVITATSVTVLKLPASGTLYARVQSIPSHAPAPLVGHFPHATYVTFRPDANVAGAAFIYPAEGGTADADTPISWQPDPLARSYRLTIGSAVGRSDLLDTGPVLSPLRVVSGLASGTKAYATLYTNYDGNLTRSTNVSFVVGNSGTTAAAILGAARSLAGVVRGMADIDNQPYDGSPLAEATASEGGAVADCSAYTTTLMAELAYANVPLQARELAVCFNTNKYDCHALVELFDSDSGRWITVDPTFGLYTLNSQGQPATSAEISAATRALSLSQLSFAYLTPAGDRYARGYYLDYPLLFLDVYQPDSTTDLVQPPPASLEPYFDLMGPAVNGTVTGYYAGQCGSGYSSATADWDGTDQTYSCTNGFTPIFWGLSVSVIPGNPSATAIGLPHRFIF
jgi:hypothetical protein